MAGTSEILSLPEPVDDRRIRVFRRIFSLPGDIEEEMQVDAYVITGKRYVVVCDTLLCPQDAACIVQAVQAELAGRQLLVFNSHADWDHCWGNSYFDGPEQAYRAPIIAHDACRARMISPAAQEELHHYQQRNALFEHVVLTPPTMTFAHTLTIHDEEHTLTFFHAPGHTTDHSALWLPELQILLAFDAVERPFPLLENAESVAAMFSTLEHFLALEPRIVLCAHGGVTDAATIEENLAYMREIERRCRLFLTNRHIDDAELANVSTLIAYPSTEALAGSTTISDPAFYSQAHEHNVRCVMRWLQGQ